MTLGKILFGYWLGKNAEERKRKRRRKIKLLWNIFRKILSGLAALASAAIRNTKKR